MSLPLYKKALKKSWDFTWSHPFLWVFGLFAAALGHMGIFEVFSRVFIGKEKTLVEYYGSFPEVLKGGRTVGVETIPMEAWVLFSWLVVIIISVFCLFTFISVCSQGALIAGAAKNMGNKKKIVPAILWHKGTTHFWQLFFLNVIKKIIVFGLVALVGFTLYKLTPVVAGLHGFVFILLFVFAALLGMFLSLLVIYAGGYLVVEDYTLSKSITSAWKLFKDHWLVSLEVGFILLLLNILVVALVFLGMFIFFLEGVLVFIFSALIGSTAILSVVTSIMLLLFLVYILFIQSVFTVYLTSVWTYLFMHMHKKGIKSHIFHLFRR